MSGQQQSVTVRDVVGFLRRHAWKLLAGLLAGGLAAGGASFLVHKTYRSTIVVMPVQVSNASGALSRIAGQLGGLASLAGLGAGVGGGASDEGMAVLRSREFTVGLIQEENLMPVLFASRWDAKAGRWQSMDPEKVPTLDDAFKYFDQKVRTIIEDRDRNLVSVRIEWRDRELAAKLANRMISKANELLRARKLAELDRTLAYLDGAAGKAESVELRQAIAAMMESQINERMIAGSRPEYAFRIIDPAVVADQDNYVSPKKALLAVIGAVLGLLAVFSWLLFRAYWEATDPAGREIRSPGRP